MVTRYFLNAFYPLERYKLSGFHNSKADQLLSWVEWKFIAGITASYIAANNKQLNAATLITVQQHFPCWLNEGQSTQSEDFYINLIWTELKAYLVLSTVRILFFFNAMGRIQTPSWHFQFPHFSLFDFSHKGFWLTDWYSVWKGYSSMRSRSLYVIYHHSHFPARYFTTIWMANTCKL